MANNAKKKLLEEATESVNAVETASVKQKTGKTREKKVFSEVTIVADGNERKAAFAKGINRIVNLKNAETICGNIKKKGYRNVKLR